MENKMITKPGRTAYRFFMLITVAAIGFVPASVFAHGQGGGKKLQLEVSSDGQSLVSKTRSNCKGHPNRPDIDEDGCFRFEKGKWDIVRIELKRKVCSQGVDNFEWKLDRVHLAGVNEDQKPRWEGPLDAVAVRDFSADPNTGELTKLDGAPGRTISFINRNNSIDGYTVWYRVRATCNGRDEIYFDPRFDNEGNP